MGFNFANYEDQQDFERWAFNRTSVEYAYPLMHTWNSLHGDKLWIRAHDDVQESIKKMYDLYVNQKKGSEI